MHIRRRWTESEGNWSQIEFFMSFKGFRMSRESWRGCVTALESRSRVIRKPATTDEMQSWILDTFACLWSPTSAGLVGLTHRNVLVMLSEALQPPSCRFALNHQENSRSTNDMAEKFFLVRSLCCLPRRRPPLTLSVNPNSARKILWGLVKKILFPF